MDRRDECPGERPLPKAKYQDNERESDETEPSQRGAFEELEESAERVLSTCPHPQCQESGEIPGVLGGEDGGEQQHGESRWHAEVENDFEQHKCAPAKEHVEPQKNKDQKEDDTETTGVRRQWSQHVIGEVIESTKNAGSVLTAGRTANLRGNNVSGESTWRDQKKRQDCDASCRTEAEQKGSDGTSMAPENDHHENSEGDERPEFDTQGQSSEGAAYS